MERTSRIRVRRALLADASVIAGYNLLMARETEGKILDPRTARLGVEGVFEEPSRGFYLVAEQHGSLVGQCMVTFEWSDWRNGTFWWVQSVYVKEEYRSRGIFGRLFRELVREAGERKDVCGIRLYVQEDNTRAREVYRNLGMEETGYSIYEVDFTCPREPEANNYIQ